MWTLTDKVCVDCGAEIRNTPANTKRCPACALKAKKSYDRQRLQEERRAAPKPRLAGERKAVAKRDRLQEDLQAMEDYNAQRKAKGLETVTYGKWRMLGSPERVTE